jgi:hypothetical protein
MERSAVSSLVKQIDQKWPERNKERDIVEKDLFVFHSDLDGSQETARRLVEEMVDSAKNGKEDNRFLCISYQGMSASGEQKDKFWKFQNDGKEDLGLIRVYFNEENLNNFKKFNIKILEKPKKTRRKKNEFPGIHVLQFKKRNRSVKRMQDKLVSKGFFINEEEIGYYGSHTCYAVSRYYREVLGINTGNIAKNGNKFGPKAWERLFENAMGN